MTISERGILGKIMCTSLMFFLLQMKFLLVLTTILLFGRINCQGTISEELDSLGLTTLLQLLEDTGLIDTLEGLGMLLDART